MSAWGLVLFPTAIGPCGIAWRNDVISGVQLPELDAAATRKRLRGRFPFAAERIPDGVAAVAIDLMTALLDGADPPLAALPLALDGLPLLDRRVYSLVRAIPRGRVRTYGDLAGELGDATLARDVGAALDRNPFPLLVPCHRAVAAGGRLGGFSAAGGAVTKRRLLAIEQARLDGEPDLFAAEA